MPSVLSEAMEFELDGRPIGVRDDWQANMIAPGGYDQFSGVAPAACAALAGADQGSLLTIWRPCGLPLYQGRLSSPPKVSQGLATLKAQGSKVILEKAQGQWPYQLRGYGDWTPRNSEPFGASGTGYHNPGEEHFQLDNSGARLDWLISQGTTISDGDAAGFLRWTPGFTPVQIAFTYNYSTGSPPDYDLRLNVGVGPDGTLSNEHTWTLGASGTKVVYTITTKDIDLLNLMLHRNGGATTGGDVEFWLTQLRVNILADDDPFSGSQVVASAGALEGFDVAGVQPTATNVLPLDFDGSGSDFLSYVKDLDDWTWLAMEDRGLCFALAPRGPALDYAPFGAFPGVSRTWRLALEGNIQESLDLMEVFNEENVSFTLTNTAPASFILRADPDPLAASGITNTDYFALDDPQPDDVLAKAVAGARLPYYSSRRGRGQVEVAYLIGPDGLYPKYELRAGDLVDLRDFEPEMPPQRVVGVTYTRDKVLADIGEDVTAEGLIALAAAKAARV